MYKYYCADVGESFLISPRTNLASFVLPHTASVFLFNVPQFREILKELLTTDSPFSIDQQAEAHGHGGICNKDREIKKNN